MYVEMQWGKKVGDVEDIRGRAKWRATMMMLIRMPYYIRRHGGGRGAMERGISKGQK